MDSGTATVIAAAIGALASIAVAFITTRAKIGAPTSPSADSPTPESVQHKRNIKRTAFRVAGWVLVVFLYLVAAGCLSAAVFMSGVYTFVDRSLPGEADAYGILSFFLLAPALFAVARWARGRLRGRNDTRSISN
jgi:hypothetical protein